MPAEFPPVVGFKSWAFVAAVQAEFTDAFVQIRSIAANGKEKRKTRKHVRVGTTRGVYYKWWSLVLEVYKRESFWGFSFKWLRLVLKGVEEVDATHNP